MNGVSFRNVLHAAVRRLRSHTSTFLCNFPVPRVRLRSCGHKSHQIKAAHRAQEPFINTEMQQSAFVLASCYLGSIAHIAAVLANQERVVTRVGDNHYQVGT